MLDPDSNGSHTTNQPASQPGDGDDSRPKGAGTTHHTLECFYSATARWPLTVCSSILVVSAIFAGLPFAIFGSEAIVFDLSLDSFSVRGNAISNRVVARDAAPEGRLRPARRAMQYHDGQLVVVYAAKDGGNVLTESRLRQALELEQRATDVLGAAIRTPLLAVFPAYPAATGALRGEVLHQKLASIAESLYDTRETWMTGDWPHFDMNFTACDPRSKLVSSIFWKSHEPGEVNRKTLAALETDDLYLAFFESENDEWFSDERDAQIASDTMLLIGVIIGVLVLMIFLTQSVFLPVMGMLSILLATGVAISIYRLCVSGWLGMLNAFSFFLLLGIGCDDIFVLSDTWRQSTELRCLAPDDYVGRLRYTLPRASKAVMTTSFTTALAFFGNALSLIPPLRLFGILAGLMVTCDFILTVVFLPSVLVLQHRLFGHMSSSSWCQAPLAGRARRLDSLLTLTCTPRLIRSAPILVVVSAILAGVSLNIALELPGAGEFHESDLFPSSHNQARAYKAQLMMKTLRPEWVWVDLVHGVVPEDTSDRNDPSSQSDVVWDAELDIYQPETQQFMFDLCNALIAQRGLVRQIFRCWAQELHAQLQQQGRAFPSASRAEVNEALEAMAAVSYNAMGIWFRGASYHSVISAWATVEDRASIAELRAHHDKWEAFMEEWNAEARRRGLDGLSRGFQSSGKWLLMSTIENLARSSINAMGLSTALATVMLLLTMRNIAMVALVMLHIMGVCLALIACLQIEGRRAGVLESICLTLLVGLAVDYFAHLATAYLEEPPGKTRVQRVVSAVAHLGSSVLAGALTTLTAGVFLCFGTITFFHSFGVFMLELITLALFASMISFVAVLSLFGPEGRFCQIPCPSYCTSHEGEQAAEDALADAVEVVAHPRRVRWATGIVALAILLISGAVRLSLSTSSRAEESAACPDMQTVEFRFQNYEIPADQDSYRCRGFDLLPPGCTYYVTEVTPLVEPASLNAVVHHMILFATETLLPTCPFTCYDMPDAIGMDAAWAVGMGSVRWPDGIAYSLGGHKQALQMHYENMALQRGLVDVGSGLRLSLSSTPPRHVLTNIVVGLHPLGDLRIPPGRTNTTFFIDCVPVLRSGVTVIAFATHAHKAGISVVTEVRRPTHAGFVGDAGGTRHYDFNYQRIEQFAPGQERRLLPGDIVRVICSYDTASRTWETFGGWGSEDEMCMTFLFVYPRNNVGSSSCLRRMPLEMR